MDIISALEPGQGHKSETVRRIQVTVDAKGEGPPPNLTGELLVDGAPLASGLLVWDREAHLIPQLPGQAPLALQTGRLLIDEPSEQVLQRLGGAVDVVARIEDKAKREVWSVRYGGVKRSPLRAKQRSAINLMQGAATGSPSTNPFNAATCDPIG